MHSCHLSDSGRRQPCSVCACQQDGHALNGEPPAGWQSSFQEQDDPATQSLSVGYAYPAFRRTPDKGVVSSLFIDVLLILW